VLRAIGLTRRQARLVLVSQATVLAVTGLALGIPLGLAAGSAVWRVAAPSGGSSPTTPRSPTMRPRPCGRWC